MNRYFFITFAFLPLFVLAGVIVLWVFGGKEQKPSPTNGLEREFALYLEVRQKLLDHYDGPLDERTLADQALVGMAQGTGDGYTRVHPPVQATRQERELRGASYGINCGIELNEDGSIRITQVMSGGGGEKAGLLVDDVIVSVDGVSVLGQTLENSRLRIQSDVKDSVVVLGIRRGGDTRRGDDPKARAMDVTVTRSEVVQYSVRDVHIETRHGRRFGFLQISDFNANTFDPQFKDALRELMEQGAEGIVIDLRNNGGGRVPPAVDMADALIAEKGALIVFTRANRESNRRNDHDYRTTDDTALTSLPIVLLVDNNTASAAEIFTGAMRDHGRALIIGDRTHGKGLVQTIFRLGNDEQYSMNITTTQYYTPLGRRVQKGDKGEPGGIMPDIHMPYRPGEQANIRNRQAARAARFNREEQEKTNRWWTVEDRMLEAALDALAGRPIKVKD
ncbi:MAG: PDZ domain-containing protein [Planctomycetes bacterium]|jgi:carboxyl-terminal processing protease|nr:PDZ domain-containing protein [Planctomycetota bacterium]MCL4729546.1 PDZ domain-containing protein [Planctomycetota bacterium]